jgi:hypothetical protein
MTPILNNKSFSKTKLAIFSGCENAFRLIREGKEKLAKEMYPLEFYLVKKYLYRNLELFEKQMADRLEV